MKKTIIGILFVFVTINAVQAQNYRSRQDGPWSSATTWQVFVGGTWEDLETVGATPYQNVIPTSASGTITISNHVSIPTGYSVTIDETTVEDGARITVNSGGTLTIASVANALVVTGSVVANEGSLLTGTTGTNVVFNAGAIYFHNFSTTQGVIPRASWNQNSELRIQGYTTFASATSSGNWTQTFGNVVWNCAAQTSTLNLNGLLTTITGDLDIRNTNTGTLQFSSTQRPTINITGNFNVEGTSAIRIATSGTAGGGTFVNIGGDFTFMPTNGSTSYLTNTGTTTVTVGGDFSMDAPGATLYLANSTGTTGLGTLNVTGNFSLQSGTITEGLNDSSTSNGRIYFVTSGGGKLHTYYNTGSITNRINYRLVSANDTLQVLGESQMIGNSLSSYTQSGGVLIVESTDANGAIQTGSGAGSGNIRVVTRTYATGSTIVYQGAAAQVIGNGHPTTTAVIINNPSGVSLNNTSSTTVSLTSLTLEQGNLTVANDNLSVNGTTSFVQLNGGNINVTSAAAARAFTVRDLILSGGDVTLTGTSNSISLIVNGNIDLQDGDITISNTSSVGTLNTYGDIAFTGGNIFVNSGTNTITSTFRGDLTGTGFLQFSGNANNVFLLGSGNLSRDFPVSGATSLQNFTVNRSSATVAFPYDLNITSNLYVRAGNLVMNGDLTIAGDLNVIDGSILNFSDHDLVLSSQFNNSLYGGELYSNAGSTLTLDGSGSVDTLFFATGGNQLGKLILDRPTSGTLLKLNTPLTIIDSLRLDNGIFDHTSGLTMSDGSVLLRHSAASMTGTAPAGTYNLIYIGTILTTGAEAQGSLVDFTSAATGTVTVASAISGTGQFLISSGTVTSGANAISTGTFVNNATFNAPSSTLTLTGDFTNNGTFNRNSGTVSFDGTAIIGGTSSTIFHSIDITALGNLTPPATLEFKGHFNNDGVFNHNNGLMLLSGTIRQDITGTNIPVNNMNVTNTTTPYSVSVDGEVNLEGTLTLSAGAQFLADGVTSNGVFTVMSLDDQPTTDDGRIAQIPASAAVLGNVTVQRFMVGKTQIVNRYISSPVTGATAGDIMADYAVQEIKWYDETVTGTADKGYVVANASDVLVSGRGYLALPTTANVTVTWDVRGPLTVGQNQGSVTLTATHTDSSPVDVNADGWNLVGNPYPSGIGWGINAGWTRSNIGATITVRDIGGPSPRYKTYTYNGTDGTGTLPNGVIAMGQSFWVWAASGGGTLIVNESAKTAMSGTFYRERGPTSKQLILALKNSQGDEDNTILKTNATATDDFDPDFDAFQFKNELLNISIYDNQKRGMLMHTLQAIPDDFVADIELDIAEPGQYSISFENAEEFLGGSKLYLVDELEQTATPVHSNGAVYTFNVVTAGVDNARFKLKRKPDFEQSNSEVSVRLFPNPVRDRLNIEARGGKNMMVTIADMKGTVVSEYKTSDSVEFDLASLPKGVYIVRVLIGGDVVLRKIVKE